MVQSVGKAPPVGFDRAVIIFDRSDGRILHVHRLTVASNNAADFEEGEVARRGLVAARSFVSDSDLSNTDMIEIEPADLERAMRQAASDGTELRVDSRRRSVAAHAGKDASQST